MYNWARVYSVGSWLGWTGVLKGLCGLFTCLGVQGPCGGAFKTASDIGCLVLEYDLAELGAFFLGLFFGRRAQVATERR